MRRSFVIAALLLGLVSTGFLAPAARADQTYTDVVSGTETSTGTINGNTRSGVTFTGVAAGQLPGQWDVAIRYMPASPDCGGSNRILNGSWTLTLTDGTVLTGRVSHGSVTFDQHCAFGQVEAELLVTSCSPGTGSTVCNGFNGGRGRFDGTLNHLPLLMGQPATLTGTLQFRF